MHIATLEALNDELEKISVSEKWVKEHSSRGTIQKITQRWPPISLRNPKGLQELHDWVANRSHDSKSKHRFSKSKFEGMHEGIDRLGKGDQLLAPRLRKMTSKKKFPIGKILAGTAALSAAAYGAKKLHDKYKKKSRK